MTPIKYPKAGDTLRLLFERQRELVDQYIVIEGLPRPEDCLVYERKTQTIIKDFASRMIEELGEAYNALETAYGCISTNHGEEAYEAIKNYNEELGDCLHFLIEMMLYSGFTHDDLLLWIRKQRYDDPRLSMLDENYPLRSFMLMADFLNHQDGYKFDPRDRDTYVIIPENEVEEQHWCAGGRRLSSKVMDAHAIFCWEITQRLNRVRNCCKSRNWVQTDKAVNLIQFNDAVIEAFIAFFRLMGYTGKSERSIYGGYDVANEKNWRRIKEKY